MAGFRKSCLVCGATTEGSSLCRRCRRRRKGVRNRERLLAVAVRDSGDVCRICGQPGRPQVGTPGTPGFRRADPITLGHDVPVSAGGTALEGYGPEHRSCNSSKGDRSR